MLYTPRDTPAVNFLDPPTYSPRNPPGPGKPTKRPQIMFEEPGEDSKSSNISHNPETLVSSSPVDISNGERFNSHSTGATVHWQDATISREKKKGIPPPLRRFSSFVQGQIGLLVTAELERALKDCKDKVQRIAKECRAGNRRFRDIEFDLENMPKMCLYGLNPKADLKPGPDVRRVSEIFEHPKFFAGAPHSSDVVQGGLGDCWFLSALSTTACSPGLIEKLCVARDEEVGVYGFIFFKDSRWVDVVIDDQLFWSLPAFDALRKEEQELCHDDRDHYNNMARKGGKGLKFARSGTSGETWVPLIEKAYAKLHGDYASIEGGQPSEAIEDLTGGISIMFRNNDILDPDRFWKEELLHANNPSLFSVWFFGLNESPFAIVGGLVGTHAYAVLRAKECEGKRFVVIRNPWGKKEWEGPWSDKSKEWTAGEEGRRILKELDHVLGDDGEFVMEYRDFLDTWSVIQRTTIFDENWIMSAHWLRIPPKPLDHCWTFGEVIYHFSLPKASRTVIMISSLDNRYFRGFDDTMFYDLDFVVYNIETKEQVGESYSGLPMKRSTTCELHLDQGTYAVYPRVDRHFWSRTAQIEESLKTWDEQKLSRVLMHRTHSRSIASNYELGERAKFVPTSAKDLAMREARKSRGTQNSKVDETINEKTTTSSIVTEEPQSMIGTTNGPIPTSAQTTTANNINNATSSTSAKSAEPSDSTTKPSVTCDDEDEYPLFIGLRVYTKKGCVVEITGKI